jgi:hypothetical protein
MKMDSKNIIMQGERAQYLMESSLPNFSFESNDYILEIIYGMADEKIVIEKKSEYYQNVVSNIIFGISAIILTICLYIQFLLPEVSKTQNITVHNNYLSAKITTQNFDTINEFIKNI